MVKTMNILPLILLVLGMAPNAGCTKEESGTITDPPRVVVTDTTHAIPGWQLVWNDEFNGLAVDSSKWSYEVNGSGGGNNELQYYTDRYQNSYVDSGALVIVARKENYLGKRYTSARMRTNFRGDWTYGKFLIRAKLPSGVGTWPAIWMLSTDWKYGGWPASGEIDIMEHVGYDQDVVHASIHTQKYYHKIGTQKSGNVKVPGASTGYHTYGLDWYPDSMEFSVDGSKYFTAYNDGSGWQGWPFDQRFHFILNIAVGGDWGGAKGVDDNIFPQSMFIDYVRVYKKNP
ncbi:MAG: glycoside hydrolase family 16 protein [Bacteroidetes bacterium]|nr:glycoside hydrolase family 16 protein [Bacteroidota bacterium]